MPYPINQRAHQFNSIQSVPVSFGLWDTALKFLSPGPRNDVTDHLDVIVGDKSAVARDCKVTGFAAAVFTKLMKLCFEKGIRKAGGGGGGGREGGAFYFPLQL